MSNGFNVPEKARLIDHATTDNIDYNDLKELIKRRTSRANGEAQPIPGNHSETRALQDFEDELYTQLKDQHARVDLFLRSKSGECSRKLGNGVTLTVSETNTDVLGSAHLLRQITDLERRSFSYGWTKISVRQLETFSKLEDLTLKYGQ